MNDLRSHPPSRLPSSLPSPRCLPLLATTDLAAPLMWHQGKAVSAGQFIAQAQALALRLPAGGAPINLCQDRGNFALGLAAALLRGQTSLMPPNALPDTLRLAPAGAGLPYALTDVWEAGQGLELGALQQVQVELLTDPKTQAPDATVLPQIQADLQAVCLLTSGSTGTPQPHAKTWGQLVANIGAQAQRLAQMMNRQTLAGLTLVATVPPQHSYGLESSVLLALLGGAAFDTSRPFYPADICAALEKVPRPRALVSTPFHLKTLLLSDLALPPAALSLSATAPLSPQLAAQVEAALGGPLIEIYGCTEAGQVASRRTTAGEVWTTLGDLQIRSQRNAANVEDDSTDSAEQFIVSGGHVSEPTPLADVLELISLQKFRLLGRANDLIHVAGKRSSLAHLNFHLNRIEGVDDGAFWLPEAEAGDHEKVQRPVAFVVAPDLTARQIIGALREGLEPAFVPRRVVHVQALPREATGKLTVATLREFALRTLADNAGPTRDIHLHVPVDHPAFAGHFPGQPVLPGAALLALVMQALADKPALQQRLGATPQISNAKFLLPVKPGTDLRLVLTEQGSGVAFEAWTAGGVVARGQCAPAVASPSTAA
jgi:3-hydroxymyristoyl/3-hydroxydecanoyl-(acyl carrier protein) dehydratase